MKNEHDYVLVVLDNLLKKAPNGMDYFELANFAAKAGINTYNYVKRRIEEDKKEMNEWPLDRHGDI